MYEWYVAHAIEKWRLTVEFDRGRLNVRRLYAPNFHKETTRIVENYERQKDTLHNALEYLKTEDVPCKLVDPVDGWPYILVVTP